MDPPGPGGSRAFSEIVLVLEMIGFSFFPFSIPMGWMVSLKRHLLNRLKARFFADSSASGSVRSPFVLVAALSRNPVLSFSYHCASPSGQNFWARNFWIIQPTVVPSKVA